MARRRIRERETAPLALPGLPGVVRQPEPIACLRALQSGSPLCREPPDIRALFKQFVAAVRSIGPVRVLPEKTRIAFQVRMSFAQITPRRQWLDGHLVLARRLEHPRFRSIQTISPRNHVHTFRIESAADIDDDFRAWLREAYLVGDQQHLEPRIPSRTSLARE